MTDEPLEQEVAESPAAFTPEIETNHQPEQRARALARRHEDPYDEAQKAPPRSLQLQQRLRVQAAVLREAHTHFASTPGEEPAYITAAEWFLDNFHIIEEAVRRVQEDMPAHYYRELPRLATGVPRIHEVAQEILQASAHRPEASGIQRFIAAYQDVTPLTNGELWALPTMLRLGLLEGLTQAVVRITGLSWPGEEAPDASVQRLEPVAHEHVVADAIRSLRTLSTLDWKAFVDRVSLVEQVLGGDPAGAYAAMDFETRNRYRRVVEEVAVAAGLPEVEVAREAIHLAAHGRAAAPAAPRAGHVGYYLIADGRGPLEERVGSEPSRGVRFRRWLARHPWALYPGAAGLVTLVLLLAVLGVVVGAGGAWWTALLAGLLALVPATTVGVGLLNWVLTHLAPPRVLPKMDFQDGIPAAYRTMVVIPALLSSEGEVTSLLEQLERHYLGNPDPHLSFALLSDFTDAPDRHMPGDADLLAQAEAGLRALNERHGRQGTGPFYLFHRERRWNPGEGIWMGWERKRGKLEEFNRLLLGSEETSYTVQLGALEALGGIRYVLTLDADTNLPPGSAHRLVGTLAHPLCHAVFDPHTGRVTAGYTILQPRTEIKLTSATQSLFTRVFAGDTGLDLYTLAVSDVYQDLFGEGIFVGKGIYDVAAFERSLQDRAPENALLSHDLFEGIHGRAALVTDIVLYEDYPPGYLTYAHRMHRWIRGDWQLLPWLFSAAPYADHPLPDVLTTLDRWKVLDNLRRSLLAPSLLALLIAGWLGLPGGALLWTLLAVLTLALPLLTGLASGLAHSLRAGSLGTLLHASKPAFLRWLLALVFLPYEALLVLDAVGSTLYRMSISRRHMLQWRTAHETARHFAKGGLMTQTWAQMAESPLLTLVLGVAISIINPAALAIAAPLLLAWLIAPLVAYRISRPAQPAHPALSDAQRLRLRSLARRTWLFFEHYVGPTDHWLPPDNFQLSPRGVVAHRTSPTNIGLLLLSTLGAYDAGYVGLWELAARLRQSFDGMDALEQYRGHLLNWYDTRTLEPLAPRYVSVVDSGNLAGCLIALRQGCLERMHAPLVRWASWEGLLDTLAVLGEVLGEMGRHARHAEELQDYLRRIREEVVAVEATPERWTAMLVRLDTEVRTELDRRLVALVEAGSPLMDPTHLHSLRLWHERVGHHLGSMQRQLRQFMPWLPALNATPELLDHAETDPAIADTWQALREALPASPTLGQLAEVCTAGREGLAQLQHGLEAAAGSRKQIQAARAWCEQLMQQLKVSEEAAAEALDHYRELAERAEAYVLGMKFDFLFDAKRQLFYIGYNLDAASPDGNYYDLLASEARLASFLAIAKGDVPLSHWLHLARPLAQVDGQRLLLSWSGTMFEYLMPALLMRHFEHTLLSQSNEAAIDRQIAYGRATGLPWGISESGYYLFDAVMNYQYRAFGVPGLGLKRGLEDDLVVAPYASLLALSQRPEAVVRNLGRLLEEGLLSDYGFYEAVDYTPARLPLGQQRGVVYSFMAHHQGMILVSLINYLKGDVMVRRFHSDPRVQSAELLLQERIPRDAPVAPMPEAKPQDPPPASPQVQAAPWNVPVGTPYPQVHYLSNGSYGVLVTNAGGGYSRWRDTDLTRWRADSTLDDRGTWIYVEDRAHGALWSIPYQPTASDGPLQDALFHPHKVDFRRQAHGVAARMELTVAPEDDVEIRLVTLVNESDRPRRIALTSYAEVVLGDQGADRRHPAFNNLFIRSEYHAAVNGLLFFRRARSGHETPAYLVHALVVEQEGPIDGAFETDRGRFLGRGRTPRNPAALGPAGTGLSGTAGATLDPIMALRQEVVLAPNGQARLAFITLAAETREQALNLARRYSEWGAIGRAFEQAGSHARREMQRLMLGTPEMKRIQQLLSALLYPQPGLRADAATLAANQQGQPGLWPHAISGDHPILMVRIRGEKETALVREVLLAHRYWRSRNLKIDLVLLNEKETGYMLEVQGMLHRLLHRTGSEAWLNRRGGIFLLRTDQMREADRVLLQTAARVALDEMEGSLAEQLQPLAQHLLSLPPFGSTRSGEEPAAPTPRLARPDGLRFDNGLGGFSPDDRSYAIYLEPGRPTPAPWINVIANPDAGFLVTEAGGGYSWALNSGENRLTPCSNDPVTDPPGEALYVRDEETGRFWSPTPQPAGEAAPYLIRHGAGHTTFEHHSHGLKQRLRLFMAPAAPVKIVHLRLENAWNRVRRITATYYAEWVLGVNRDEMQQYLVPEYDDETQALLARNPYHPEFGERVAFLAASKAPHGLTADRTEFLGRLGSRQRPAALTRIGLAGTVRPGVDPCAAIQLHIDLPPGGVEEVYFMIGQGADRADAVAWVRRFQDPERVEAAWNQVNARWSDLLGAVTVDTPDPAMNLLLNQWLPYQNLSCRIWGRSAFYQSSGAYGFRDQLQDVMALLHAAPDLARAHLLRAAHHQFEEGDVLHWWHPPAGRGVRTRISDDLLWLPFVLAHYVTTTGDASILTEQVPFLRGEPLGPNEEERYGHYEPTEEAYTLYEHACRALAKGTTAGPHGLPLIGGGDWNDGMNHVGLEGRGESVWLGWFLYATLMRFAPLCGQMNDDRRAASCREQAERLRDSLEANAWDGRWYRRAYYDDGTPLGSAENRECRIDSIAQSWSVLSGAGGPERAARAMQAVRELLVRSEDRLLLLFTPPFDETPRDPGYIKGYPPGIRENGGQYTHAAIWAVWAFAVLGDGDRAGELFRLLNPVYHADTPEKAARYRVEPYVIAADVYGAPPHTGRGGWTWYTGSGGWMYRLGLEALLGLRREDDTLRCNPCIPKSWPGFTLTYRYGAACYTLHVENPDGVQRGVSEVTLDGEALPDGVIPLRDDGRHHDVHIVL